jgi:glucose-1-phosphate thymidylyltransferase
MSVVFSAGDAEMKAVILARGLGKRMRSGDDAAALDPRQRAAADTGVKAMIPVGRPFLDYVLSALADAGCRRVCLVIGPNHQAIRDYYGRQVVPRRLSVEFAVQQEARGTADAVAAAESFAGGDLFLMINSDNYYPPQALGALTAADGPAVALFDRQGLLAGGNIPPERVSRFSVGQSDGRGFLKRIIEKPDEAALAALPQPIYVSMNCWRFSPAIFAACRAIGPSPRGEFELPDAVQYAIDVLGERFRVEEVHAPVLDLTSRSDIAAVAALLAGREVDL